MDVNEAVLNSLLALPERIHKLETALGEQWVLIDTLLSKSGLDAAGIDRAHAYAKDSWKEIVEELGRRNSEKWLATPEGQGARRATDEDMLRRRKELWREDCVEAGRILPDPTA